jgi:uncharacterized protein (DUF885 family)
MFKRVLKWLLGIGVVLGIALAVFLINLIFFRPWSLNLFYEKVFAEVIFSEPELLSALGLVEQFGITGHNGKLSDESPAHQEEVAARWRKDLTQLRAYSLSGQSESNRLSIYVLIGISREKSRRALPIPQLPGEPTLRRHNQFPISKANTHRLLSPRDCNYYLQRLGALPVKFDQTLEGLRLRDAKGIIPPRFVVEEVLTEMRNFVAQPASANILAASFKTRAAKINGLSEQQRADFQSRVESSITAQVYPAYQKLIAYFQALLPKTTTDDGVWKLPDGAAYYAYMLRLNTTTSMSPNEVHELGLREVARIEGEMRLLLDANGFSAQPIGQAMTSLGKDPRFLYPNDDAGRSAALEDYHRLIDDATRRCAGLFRTTPRAVCEVRRVPAFKEATAPGAYYEGASLDGTRPGVFYANLRNMNEVAKWSMPTLAYHEGVPGHHWQISTAQELKGLPQFRKVIPFTAYMEGWALYAEWLAKEAGWYANDPFGDLGRLQAELFRAVRLVVDTGIHEKRWTREQAIAYMREKTGMTEGEITSEIERYIVSPGQACAYKVGMLKIQELRTRAQQRLGEKFDEREFHDVLLKNGALPLEILEEQVSAYLKEKKA